MDILILLLFMAIFYLGPALLKRYLAKKNIQSAVPELLNPEMMNASPKIKTVEYMASATGVQSSMVVDKAQSVPAIVEEQSAWHGKLEQNMITNGVIFAEILQPPRAYRPFVRR
ncbi:MAG: hypothetical protein H6Q68_1073 [Firmicutes bacterium]|nr:hypothetical protein [Bacillota bacterium]